MEPLLNRVMPTSGGGGITPPPDPNQPFDFIASEGHGEFPLPMPAGCVTEAFDRPDDAYDMTEDELAELWNEQNPGVPMPDADLTWESIVRITATREQLEEAMAKMLVEVLSGPTGGDDDTFDYWPSGVRLTMQIAEQLGGTWPYTQWPTITERAARAAITETRTEFTEELLQKCHIAQEATS